MTEMSKEDARIMSKAEFVEKYKEVFGWEEEDIISNYVAFREEINKDMDKRMVTFRFYVPIGALPEKDHKTMYVGQLELLDDNMNALTMEWVNHWDELPTKIRQLWKEHGLRV